MFLAVKRVPLTVWALLIALLPVLTQALHGALQLPFGGPDPLGLQDPDSWLRLGMVRDWLSGGSWYDHSYLSNTPGDAMVSPWTRPLDLVIAFFTKLQFTDAPLTLKLVRTALLLPILWMALLAGALLFTMRRLTPMPHARIMLAVLLVTAPINYNYFGTANADHHAPLAALFAWIAAILITQNSKLGHIQTLLGALLALMLWISPEALLPLAIVYGWLGLQWLAGNSLRPLARVATVTTVLAGFALMIERPVAQWTERFYDSLSIAQLVPLALVALICLPLSRITSFFWLWRALAALFLLGVAALFIHVIDPLFFHGPMAMVDRYIITDFLPRITEAMHAWREPPLKLFGLLLQPLFALYVAFRCASQRNGIIAPGQSATLLYLLVTTLALYFAQIRWSYYFFPLVPLALAPYLASWLNPQHSTVTSYWPAKKLRRFSDKQMLARRAPLLIILLVLPAACIVGSGALQKKYQTTMPACHKDVRRLIQNGELAEIGKGKTLNVFIAGDAGTELLFFTPYRIIASNYHREGAGLRDLTQAHLTRKPAKFQRVLKERQIDLAVLCPDAGAPTDAAINRLRAGNLTLPGLTRYKIKTQGLSKTPPGIFLVKATGR